MRKAGMDLFTLETKTPVKELDFLGFTLQYELSFTNVVNMLDLGKIPILAVEKKRRRSTDYSGRSLCLQPGTSGGYRRRFF